jgi:hypothetical protein
MMRAVSRPGVSDATALQVRVVGPDSPTPTPLEVRRLFSHRLLSRARRERLARSAKVLAACDGRIIGLASFERGGDDIRVHEFAFEPDLSFSTQDILRQLLDALELACLASGGRRLVLLPNAIVAVSPLERLGYRIVNEGCAGAWLEKTFA